MQSDFNLISIRIRFPLLGLALFFPHFQGDTFCKDGVFLATGQVTNLPSQHLRLKLKRVPCCFDCRGFALMPASLFSFCDLHEKIVWGFRADFCSGKILCVSCYYVVCLYLLGASVLHGIFEILRLRLKRY